MSTVRTVAVSFLVAMFLVPALQAQTTRAQSEVTLRQMEQELVAAALRHDWRSWDRMVAPEWTCIDQFGRQWDKPAILTGLKTTQAALQSGQLYNVQIRFIKDDVAMATGTLTATIQVSGKTIKTTVLSTDILVERQGKWLVVASLATPVKPAS